MKIYVKNQPYLWVQINFSSNFSCDLSKIKQEAEAEPNSSVDGTCNSSNSMKDLSLNTSHEAMHCLEIVCNDDDQSKFDGETAENENETENHINDKFVYSTT